MKFQLVAGAAALASLALPSTLSADDGLKYEDLVHCAATNLVIAQVLGMKDADKTQNKADIDKYNDQAAALMAIASVSAKKQTDAVLSDTRTEENSIVGIIGDQTKSDGFIQSEVPKCKTMGEAAVQVIAEQDKK